MESERGSVLHGLLALINGRERVEGRIRLQKEAYLLGLKGYRRFPPKRFIFYYYGPYSREVSDALHFGVVSNLIEELEEDISGKRRYSYQLTEEGRDWLDSETDASDKLVDEYRATMRAAPWRALELAASAVFLERVGEASDREMAFSKALALKPDCKPFQDDARRVLRELKL